MIFSKIKSTLGNESFSSIFEVLLADRGVEFSSPSLLENDKRENKLISVFYCNPQQSQQKDKVERIYQNTSTLLVYLKIKLITKNAVFKLIT